MDNSLKVAESFYSIQGEGCTVGIPAFFLRLQHCVLNCQWCDTVDVWKQGQVITFQDIKERLMAGMVPKFDNKEAHLVISGGEPLMQQAQIIRFLHYLREEVDPVVEIETAGVLEPDIRLARMVRYWNVSPKLANSGEKEFKRMKHKTIKLIRNLAHAFSSRAIFKFVVASRLDVVEALETYIRPCEIDPWDVYLMPCASTRAQHEELAPEIIEYAKEFGYRFSPRLHLAVWDRATGV